MRGLPYLVRTEGLRRPKRAVRVVDMAGHVEAVGKDVIQVQPGEEVFGWGRFGALAEYERAGENTCVPKPVGLTFEQAAAIPMAGCTALQALRDKGQLQPGQRVLISGAAGGIGTFAVQIAKAPFRAFVVSRFVGQRMLLPLAQLRKEDLLVLKELIEARQGHAGDRPNESAEGGR
jgi:NADPH:quinone reductase-like Zn-dependent oxidoreductase